MFVKLFDYTTIFISCILLIKTIKKIKLKTRYVYFVIFFTIYVVPLILDYLIAAPNYLIGHMTKNYSGFIYSQNDELTRIIYDFFLILVQLILLYYKPKLKIFFKKTENKDMQYLDSHIINRKYLKSNEQMICLFFACIAPLLVLILGNNSMILFKFGWRDIVDIDYINSLKMYSTLEKLSYIGVVASLSILCIKADKKNIYIILLKISSLLLLYMNLCIESKRSILFFALVVFILIQIYIKNDKKSIMPFICLTRNNVRNYNRIFFFCKD